MSSTIDNEKRNLFPTSKKIDVQNTASLIDLKAELLKRKQEAVSDKPGSNFGVKGGACKWKKLAADLEAKGKDKELERLQRRRNDQNQTETNKKNDEDLERALRLSKEALERKSRLYEERMKKALEPVSDSSEDEREDESLVNFQEKILLAKRMNLTNHVEQPSSSITEELSDEDWVEFTDSLGRTRKCLKEDVAYYKKLDESTRRENHSDSSPAPHVDHQPPPATAAAPVEPVKEGPLHYQDVRNNEVRDLGVGYFAFSTETEERRKQFQTLNSLREQTQKQRETRMRMRERKKMALEDRLKKVAQRKGIQLKAKEQKPVEDTMADLRERLMKEDERHEEILNTKTEKVRNWDVGKVTEDGITLRDCD